MTPADFLKYILDPGLAFVEHYAGIPLAPQSRLLMLAIPGQESNWSHRKQIPVAYARSFFQFERGGGVAGVLQHPASASRIRNVCAALDIPCDVDTVYEVMTWNDTLAVAMARLLLWTDPAALPAVGDRAGAWEYYLRCWRPGAPHPATWPIVYGTSMVLTG